MELYQHSMILFKEFLHILSFFFTILSIGIICFGFFKSVFLLLQNRTSLGIDKIMKGGMDKYILVALQFLIVADIIDTIILRDLQNIIYIKRFTKYNTSSINSYHKNCYELGIGKTKIAK